MTNIYVEGKDDENFVVDIIKTYLNPATEFKIIVTGGWEKIVMLNNVIEQNKDLGGTNYILFDADSNYALRKSDILKLITKPSLIDNIYLFPNNQDTGCLETLLLQMAHPAHKNVHTCFDSYRLCVNGAGTTYSCPDDKSKIYSYLSCLGANSKIGERNYVDAKNWDLKHADLQKLINYLSTIL